MDTTDEFPDCYHDEGGDGCKIEAVKISARSNSYGSWDICITIWVSSTPYFFLWLFLCSNRYWSCDIFDIVFLWPFFYVPIEMDPGTYVSLFGCTRLTVACDKVYQLLPHSRCFSPGTPASSTIKTRRHDIAEILLKVALNTK